MWFLSPFPLPGRVSPRAGGGGGGPAGGAGGGGAAGGGGGAGGAGGAGGFGFGFGFGLGLLFVVLPFVGGVDGLDETGAAGGAVTVTLTN
jgi:hypothetical protein